MLLTIVVLYLARDVLIPLALAILLTFLLAPLVCSLERWRIPRTLAVMAAVGLSAITVGGVVWVVENQLIELAGRLPQYETNIKVKLDALRQTDGGALGGVRRTLAELKRDIARPATRTNAPKAGVETAASQESEPLSATTPDTPVPVTLVEPPTALYTYVRGVLGPLLAPLATVGIAVVFTVFMLMRRESLRYRLIRLVGCADTEVMAQTMADAAQRVGLYLRMQLIVNGVTGLVIGAGLYWIGVPNAALWGLLAALLRFLPIVGIWVAASLPLAVSVAVSPGWTQPALTLGLFVVVEIVCGNVVEPLLFGSKTGVAPLAILVAAVFWTWLWGGTGLLLSTPITVCVAVIGRHVPQLRFLDILLGDDSAQQRPSS